MHDPSIASSLMVHAAVRVQPWLQPRQHSKHYATADALKIHYDNKYAIHLRYVGCVDAAALTVWIEEKEMQ